MNPGILIECAQPAFIKLVEDVQRTAIEHARAIEALATYARGLPLDMTGEFEPRLPRPRKSSSFRPPTAEQYAERQRLFDEYFLVAHQLGHEDGDQYGGGAAGTQARLAHRKHLTVSEISRWLPARKGRKRGIAVGSQTDINITRAIQEEVTRIEGLLSSMTHGE
jgi:hypothetical protein